MKRTMCILLCIAMLFLTACAQNTASKRQENTTTLLTPPSTQTSSTTFSTTQPTTSDTETGTSGSTSQSTPSTSGSTTTKAPDVPVTPPVQNNGEMRGAWVSFLELDTMFVSCTSVSQAKTALSGMLDTLEEFKVNTLYFHVRANSDAYYASSLFKPAASVSSLLASGFDPLAYTIELAHKRGIEVHAWVNPYRVGGKTEYRVGNTPVFTDAAKKQYYVPTSKAAQKLILDGIRELVNHYAIDGVQYDDYFYPANLLKASVVDAAEQADYTAYKNAGGTLSVADWRRAAVDTLVAGTHQITAAKGIVFGVSPAGDAQKTYNELYANPRKWMSQSGYIDYICPQIYYGFQHSAYAFDATTDTWLSYPRHASVKLYVGLAVYKAGLKSDTYAGTGKTEWANHTDVLKRSVLYLRQKNVSGFAFYSYSYLKPRSVAGLSATNTVATAEKEVANLKAVL